MLVFTLAALALLCVVIFLLSNAFAESSKVGSAQPVSDSATATTLHPLVYRLNIEGAIGAVTDDRVGDAIEIAEKHKAELLLVYLDTPGGFSNATSNICKKFLNSNVPVCVYIAPAGAHAGSAGVYMTYAAHFAAMAHSTNIGAAHPVSGDGKEIDSIMNEKVTNDAVAQIKAAAQKRGRNIEWAEQAVRQSVSITYQEALSLKVINFVAEDQSDLFRQLEGQETDTPVGKKTVHLIGARVEELPISWVYKLLQILTSPDIVFILFSIGGLGIVLELYNPGAILPGVVGAISLIVAFYAFQTLPINYAGVALILLAIILFIAEVKVISHGLLTVGGVVCLFLGGLMLVDTVDPDLRVSKTVLITTSVLIGAVAVTVLTLVAKAQKTKPFGGIEGMVGRIAEVRTGGYVFVEGALWRYESLESLTPGMKVKVTAVRDLIVTVEKEIVS